MSNVAQDSEKGVGRFRGDKYRIPFLVCLLLVGILVLGYLLQAFVERNALPPEGAAAPKEEYEIAKLAAEIRQIRSDTYGSLFWLKAVALFVTVGGAVGGYLIGQSKTTERRLEQEREIENRKNVDAQYQSLVQELSDSNSAVLRATAAVKMGHILETFPSEWESPPERQKQIIELTKKVLAAALAIETDAKVQKTLTSALVLHKSQMEDGSTSYADLRGIDLSLARAEDAYWARVDFTYADFYRARLTMASLKRTILRGAQFRETDLTNTVLIEADCTGTNFKLADLRGADLTRAKLVETNFEGAKVHGATLAQTRVGDVPETQVDISAAADGSHMLSVREWLSRHDVGPAQAL